MVEYYLPASYSLPHVTVSADQQYGNNALQQRCSVDSTRCYHYLVGYSLFLLRLPSWDLRLGEVSGQLLERNALLTSQSRFVA